MHVSVGNPSVQCHPHLVEHTLSCLVLSLAFLVITVALNDHDDVIEWPYSLSLQSMHYMQLCNQASLLGSGSHSFATKESMNPTPNWN